jgi:hypothetical protein
MPMRPWLSGLMLVALSCVATTGQATPPRHDDPAASLRWSTPIEVARGAGVRGPWQQNDSRYDFVDDPTVVLATDGAALVAWVDQARKAVLLQRFSATGRPLWRTPVDVSRQPSTFSWLPRLALASDAPHVVYALWQEIIFSGGSHGGDMLFARSVDGGRSFETPRNLSRSVGGDGKGRIHRDVWHNGSFDLVAGPKGRIFVAWTDYEGHLWLCQSHDGGARFTSARQVAPAGAAGPARAPSLALGPQGELYLAWSVGEDTRGDIHFMRKAWPSRPPSMADAPSRRARSCPGAWTSTAARTAAARAC